MLSFRFRIEHFMLSIRFKVEYFMLSFRCRVGYFMLRFRFRVDYFMLRAGFRVEYFSLKLKTGLGISCLGSGLNFACLSPFLIGRMFLREPSWKYSAKLVGS